LFLRFSRFRMALCAPISAVFSQFCLPSSKPPFFHSLCVPFVGSRSLNFCCTSVPTSLYLISSVRFLLLFYFSSFP
jgi:hypothetical protein